MKKYVLKLKVKILDIEAKKLVCILNEYDAKELGVFALERIHILNPKNNKSVHSVIDTTDSFVKKREIGLFNDVAKALKVSKKSFVEVAAVQKPKSISFIRKKLDKKKLSAEELKAIVSDITQNKLSDVETSAFITAVYINGFDLKETVAMTKALVAQGKKINFKKALVVDKHSIGGTNGRTTMVIVPIIAANNILIPKTSSRTITSSSGTADAMEVLAPVNLSIEKIKSITQKIGGVIVWGGAVDLAPADDKIIRIEHPLSLDPQGQVIASVMAKKASAGAKFVVIDLPVGSEVKIKNSKEAKEIALKFLKVGKELGIKTKVIISNGEDPSGRAFGPALEAKYALEVLEGKIFDNFAKKSIELAGALLELSGAQKPGKGLLTAKKTLESGLALKKMKQIISAQGGKIISSRQVKLANLKKIIFAAKNGKIKKIHIKKCTNLARISGAPADKKAGILLSVIKSQKVKIGQPLFEIFAQNKQKLELAVKTAKKNNPIEI